MTNDRPVPRLEFLFDVTSPASYLAWRRLPALVEETGAAIDYKPVLLGGIFKATGNAPPLAVPAKHRYFFVDMQRCAARDGTPITPNPHFPVITVPHMRGAIAAMIHGGPDLFTRYCDAMFTAMWAEARNLADPGEIARVVSSVGIEPTVFQGWIGTPEIKDRLRAETEAAIARGVFGLPTFFVGDEMFFGQDRMDFVRDALRAEA